MDDQILDQYIKDQFFGEEFINKAYASIGMHRNPRDNKKMSHFSPYGYFDINDISTYYREYLFFTKPHLNMNGLGSYSPQYYNFITNFHPNIATDLCSGGTGFIPILTNTTVPTNGTDVPDSVSMEIETMTNIYGANVSYKGHSLESKYDAEFTVEFADTRFLDVYMMFHFWDMYSSLKTLGYMETLQAYQPPFRRLDDQISVFKIVVGADLSQIVYFGKWTGVFPKNVPKSVFSTVESGNIRIPVQFKAFDYDDMDPVILDEFNMVAGGGNGHITNNYEGAGAPKERWSSAPYITQGIYRGRPIYKLKWR